MHVVAFLGAGLSRILLNFHKNLSFVAKDQKCGRGTVEMTFSGTTAAEFTIGFNESAHLSTSQPKLVHRLRQSVAVSSATSLTKLAFATRTSLRADKAEKHFVSPEKIEVLSSLDQWAERSLLPFLNPVEKCWQPEDYLPDPCCENFYEQVRDLRTRSADLPQEYLVCLVGDMITEEALPTYQTMLNTLEVVRDLTGASPSPWARWSRAWTAEENRHGNVLSRYLYLTGRVNMRQVDKTIQYLIGSGMDPGMECDPYLGFVYTSFQERATFISHGNTARMAKQHGDVKLAQICGAIAADEKRHEKAYTNIMEKLFEVDPSGAMEAFGKMMRRRVTMPAHLMRNGEDDEKLFERFSIVAERLGVYTGKDYADIVEHLVQRWKVESIEGLSSRARQEQDYVCGLARRIRKVEDRAQALKERRTSETRTFSWIAQ